MKKLLLLCFLFVCIWAVPCYATPTYDASGYWNATFTVQFDPNNANIPAGQPFTSSWNMYISQNDATDTFGFNVWDPSSPTSTNSYFLGSIAEAHYTVTSNMFSFLPIGSSFPEHADTGWLFRILNYGGSQIQLIADMTNCTMDLTSSTEMTMGWEFRLSEHMTYELDPYKYLTDPSVWSEDDYFKDITGHFEVTATKVSTVPAPASILLVFTGMASLGVLRKKFKIA
ncbi:MAG: PEP-CTERM sorting domain-containing protein [Proteobacteria bacterium]|nr:PEP-CTERM sorting domain-containing protein [Pseudomonadota bacterium]